MKASEVRREKQTLFELDGDAEGALSLALGKTPAPSSIIAGLHSRFHVGLVKPSEARVKGHETGAGRPDMTGSPRYESNIKSFLGN